MIFKLLHSKILHFNLCQIIGPENINVLNNANSHIIFHKIKDFETETDEPKHGRKQARH